MREYPAWSKGTPNTNPKAKINKWRTVDNTRAIEANNASYRNAVFDGIFELEEQNSHKNPIIEIPLGKLKVKVICSWFGVIPPTTYPKIDLTKASYKILANYSGDVADNIGKEDPKKSDCLNCKKCQMPLTLPL